MRISLLTHQSAERDDRWDTREEQEDDWCKTLHVDAIPQHTDVHPRLVAVLDVIDHTPEKPEKPKDNQLLITCGKVTTLFWRYALCLNLTVSIPISENLHLCLLASCCYDNNADIDIDVTVAIKALNVHHQRWRQITTKCHIKVISLTCPSLEVFRHARRHLLVKLLLVLKACESSVRGVALLCPVYT